MDLSPYTGINPCGLEGQAVTQMKDFGISIETERAGRELAHLLIGNINRG
jgi:lipoyl(octanoyl) transferase